MTAAEQRKELRALVLADLRIGSSANKEWDAFVWIPKKIFQQFVIAKDSAADIDAACRAI